MFRKFKLYQPHLAQRYVYVQLQKAIPKLIDKHSRIRIKKQPENMIIEVEANSESKKSELLQKILQIKNDAQADFLAKNTYSLFTNTFGNTLVKPDHIRIAVESIPLMKPIVENVPQDIEGYITRDSINYVLSWIQSIPYNDLESRATSLGSGFSPPISYSSKIKVTVTVKAHYSHP
ncbi:hypothetical protein [Catenovulum sediminis]|uniref:hypothetical protein n=1 Tax=Catenovulum sediminis TaxID=1740262 RepID=UPI00117EBA48|nr:hypothetical protein [Catenovulum sediminis]